MLKKKSIVNKTYKSQDTEELLDILFYRPIGYVLALAAKKVGLSPNAVTVLSIFVGVTAGHLFYYQDMTLNIYGMLLLILAEAMDSADGQLARMLDMKSRFGRILDGLGGNLWFLSIYIHLSARIIESGGSSWVILLMFVAGISHSLQSALADYGRNYYVLFVRGKSKSEIDNSFELMKEYSELSWGKNFLNKLFMRMYINYTIEQEMMTGAVRRLHKTTLNKYSDKIPEWLRDYYASQNKPFIKYFNILTTNTRMWFLFLTLFLGMPVLYFVFEVTVLNLLLIYVIYKQKNTCEHINEMVINGAGGN